MDIQNEIEKSLISCVVSRKDGVPLHELNDDFRTLTGYSIPFLSLGYSNLKSFLSSIEYIYLVKDDCNNDLVIVDSKNSRYMKRLVDKQKRGKRKRNLDQSSDLKSTISSIQTSVDSNEKNIFSAAKKRKSTLLKKETMDYLTPIMYGYQLMGDDIFFEIAENHLMVVVNKTAPKRCGLCITGQTILDLIDNINLQEVLSHRVAILIGLADLLNGRTSEEMINDMKLLITELKNRKLNAILFTLPILNYIPKYYYSTLHAFNDYIISQQNENQAISVLHLNHYFSWMDFKKDQLVKTSDILSKEAQRTVILEVLQNYLLCMNNIEE